MSDPFASGDWKVSAGKEDEFIDRWREFLQWTRKTQPALISASLLRDADDPRHFLSFAQWSDEDARAAWKNGSDFSKYFSACRALCDDMQGSNHDRVVTI